jgi:predicted transcriptional regulator
MIKHIAHRSVASITRPVALDVSVDGTIDALGGIFRELQVTLVPLVDRGKHLGIAVLGDLVAGEADAAGRFVRLVSALDTLQQVEPRLAGVAR